MKHSKIVPLAGLMMLALASTNVQAADSASSTINLNIDVPATCVLGAPSDTDITFDVDENTAVLLDGTAQTVTFGDSYCNGAHVMRLTSQNDGIKTEETATSGTNRYFARSINYTAKVQHWENSEQMSMTTQSYDNNTRTKTEDISAAHRNPAVDDSPLTISISGLEPDRLDGVPANIDLPLLEGTYSDTLTLEISMAL